MSIIDGTLIYGAGMNGVTCTEDTTFEIHCLTHHVVFCLEGTSEEQDLVFIVDLEPSSERIRRISLDFVRDWANWSLTVSKDEKYLFVSGEGDSARRESEWIHYLVCVDLLEGKTAVYQAAVCDDENDDAAQGWVVSRPSGLDEAKLDDLQVILMDIVIPPSEIE